MSVRRECVHLPTHKFPSQSGERKRGASWLSIASDLRSALHLSKVTNASWGRVPWGTWSASTRAALHTSSSCFAFTYGNEQRRMRWRLSLREANCRYRTHSLPFSLGILGIHPVQPSKPARRIISPAHLLAPSPQPPVMSEALIRSNIADGRRRPFTVNKLVDIIWHGSCTIPGSCE